MSPPLFFFDIALFHVQSHLVKVLLTVCLFHLLPLCTFVFVPPCSLRTVLPTFDSLNMFYNCFKLYRCFVSSCLRKDVCTNYNAGPCWILIGMFKLLFNMFNRLDVVYDLQILNFVDQFSNGDRMARTDKGLQSSVRQMTCFGRAPMIIPRPSLTVPIL